MNDTTLDLLQIKIEQAKEKLPVETLNAIAAVDWRAAIMRIREKKGYNFEQLGALETETELLLCGLVSSNDYPKEVQRRMNISRAETDEIINEMNINVFRKIKEELIKNAERKKIFEKKREEEKALEPEKIITVANHGASIPSAKTRPNDGSVVDSAVLKNAGIEVVKSSPVQSTGSIVSSENREELINKIEHPAPSSLVEPVQDEAKTPRMGDMKGMLQDKIMTSVKVPIVKTEHTMENIQKESAPTANTPDVPSSAYGANKDPYRLSPDE